MTTASSALASTPGNGDQSRSRSSRSPWNKPQSTSTSASRFEEELAPRHRAGGTEEGEARLDRCRTDIHHSFTGHREVQGPNGLADPSERNGAPCEDLRPLVIRRGPAHTALTGNAEVQHAGAQGDQVVVKGHRIGMPDRKGEVLEAREPDGSPPFLGAGTTPAMRRCCSQAPTL